MADVSLVLGRGLKLQAIDNSAPVIDRTFTLAPDGTFTVTLSPGDDVSFSGTVTPTLFSTGAAVTIPSSVSPSGGSYVLTCTNNLTTGAASATAGFGMTVTVGSDTITLQDPTMIFNPPD